MKEFKLKKLKPSRYNVLFEIDDSHFLLINEYTGSVNLIDSCLVPFLVDETPKDHQQLAKELGESVKKLLKEGYLVEESGEKTLRKVEEKCLKARKLLQGFVHIIVTYNCNMNCIYCYEQHLRKKEEKWLKKRLTKPQVDRIFDAIYQIDSAYNSRKSTVILTGGEPLLQENLEIVKYILETTNNYAYDCGIATNGIELKRFIPILKHYGVRFVQVTLDGPKQVHDKMRPKKNGSGTFDILVKGIDALLDEGISTILRVNLNMLNIRSLPELLKFIQSKDWTNHENFRCDFEKVFGNQCSLSWKEFAEELSQIKPLCPSDIFKQILISGLDAIFRRAVGMYEGVIVPKFFWCYACGKLYIFDPHGYIYSCVRAVGNEKFAVGSFANGLDLWPSFQRWRNRTIFNISKCKLCKYAFMCGGGCGFRAYAKTEDIMTPECDSFYDFKNHFLPLFLDQFKNEIFDLTPRIHMFHDS